MPTPHISETIEKAFQHAFALHKANRIDEARLSYEKILAQNGDHLNSLHLLGLLLSEAGEIEPAEQLLNRALNINPHNEGVLFSLGNLNHARGDHEKAASLLQQALVVKPDYTEALHNLAVIQLAQDNSTDAMKTVLRNLKIRESAECRAIFCQCLTSIDLAAFTQEDVALISGHVVSALQNSWSRPAALVPACLALLSRDASIAGLVQESIQHWPQLAPHTNALATLAACSESQLLAKLLASTIIPSANFEKALTNLRFLLLSNREFVESSPALLELTCALAQHCYINEYVFSASDSEESEIAVLLGAVRATLAEGSPVTASALLTLALYIPLSNLVDIHRLADDDVPPAARPVLKQQIEEPLAEAEIAASLTVLTPIEDSVSKAVREQYEQNPYPRWVQTARLSGVSSIYSFLGRMFPWARISPPKLESPLSILIAGCGTGQQAINTSQRFPTARILAIDLSVKSLSYAQRKAQEAGCTNITFAQADILQLPENTRDTFDVIESTGVLHHLENPQQGWNQLLALLKPGGFMNLALYSELGRQDVVEAKSLIDEIGLSSSGDDIRQCRQRLIELSSNAKFQDIIQRRDFYSLSSCRDLLFHECEHRFSLEEIDAYLKNNGLALISLQLSPAVLQAFRARYPTDTTMNNLSNWSEFETSNPSIFRGMYQFWVQKLV